MKKVITIQVVRPPTEGLTNQQRQQLIQDLARGIAEQIVLQEEIQKLNETVGYWQHKLLVWQLEEAQEELRYEQLKTSKQINE